MGVFKTGFAAAYGLRQFSGNSITYSALLKVEKIQQPITVNSSQHATDNEKGTKMLATSTAIETKKSD